MKVRCYSIEWAVDESDAEDNRMSVDEIHASLPTEVVVEVDELDEVPDVLSDQVGWLVRDFRFDTAE